LIFNVTKFTYTTINKTAFQSKADHPWTRYTDTLLCSAPRCAIAPSLNRYVHRIMYMYIITQRLSGLACFSLRRLRTRRHSVTRQAAPRQRRLLTADRNETTWNGLAVTAPCSHRSKRAWRDIFAPATWPWSDNLPIRTWSALQKRTLKCTSKWPCYTSRLSKVIVLQNRHDYNITTAASEVEKLF